MTRLVILTEIISPYRIPVFNALARHFGIDLHVIFLSETDPTRRQWMVYKEEIQFSYEVLHSWRRRVGRYHILLNRGLKVALTKAKPDVLVCGGYNYLASWHALLWARRKGAPYLVWVESTAKDLRGGHNVVELLKARFLNSCSGFIVPGKASFRYLQGFGINESRIFTAPNAVDTEFFAFHAELARRNAEHERKSLGLPSRYFLFAGRLVEGKGIFELIEAYGKLTAGVRSAVSLVFVGGGVSYDALAQRAAAISPGFVQLAGFQQREQLAKYYAFAETFVFPTHSDPWGLVVNEAMSCALPIICSNVAGCAEDLVSDGWNGRLIPPRDVSQLASAMEEMAREEGLRTTMARHSAERIQNCSPEICAEGIARAAMACKVPAHV